MIIKNKLESIDKIKSLNLNRFSEEIFRNNEEDRVKEFIKNNKAEYYAIRDKSTSNGLFKLSVPYDEVLNNIKNYKLYTINISSINYSKNQILVGEIEVLKDNSIYCTLSNNSTYSVRDAIRNPDYNLNTDVFDKRLKHIKGFDIIYKYIVDNNLLDVIVEFAVFDKKVGIKNDFVIIYELRTEY